MKHIRLLIKWSEVRSTGNISTYSSVKIIDSESYTIFSNGCSKDRNIGSSSSSSLKRCSCICKDQIGSLRNKTVDNSRTGIGITLCILLIKFYRITHLFGDGILKTFGCGIQCIMLNQLTDTDGVSFFFFGAYCGSTGSCYKSCCEYSC